MGAPWSLVKSGHSTSSPLATAGSQRRCSVLGPDPPALACDADGLDQIPVGGGSGQHVARGDARDVMFGRLAAEQHDESGALSIGGLIGHGATVVFCFF